MELSTSQRRGRPEVFLLLSLLLHALFLWLVRMPQTATPARTSPLEVTLLERPRIEEAPPAPERRIEQGQFVQVPIESPTTEPVDTKYLAEKSQKVDVETWKPEVTNSVGAAPGRNTQGKDAALQAGGETGAIGEARADKREAAAAAKPAEASEAPESAAQDAAEATATEGEWLASPRRPASRAARKGTGSAPSLDDILPTGTQLARLEPRAGGNEYLPDLPEGDRTRVNTREFKHYSYYVKLREKISLAWDFPREGAGKDGEVQLAIKINPDGSLGELKMVRGSGFAPFDDEAMEAVQMAAPFEPTPAEIREKDGRLALTFTFHYIGGRLFRVR